MPAEVAWPELRTAVAAGNIPTLLMVLVQLTGDLSWLEDPYRLSRTRGMSDNDTGGLTPDLQMAVREAATDAIGAWLQGRPVALPDPSPELLARMLSASMGEDVPQEYGPMLRAELLAIDHTASSGRLTGVPEGFRVAIIGAGITGLAAAVTMQRLGIPYVVLERADSLGGVWRENDYPGAGVDTPSHLYSYSFAPHDWEHFFAQRDEILEYLEGVARQFDINDNIEFNTHVRSASYSPDSQSWLLEIERDGGPVSSIRANVLLSAVGAFNVPKMPDIPGLESFEGACFHTARWPSDVSVAGKSVAVIGNGASAMQVVPAIAADVKSLVVFQRAPQWAQPFDKLHVSIPDELRFLFRHVPLYRLWYRLRLTWIFHDKLYEALQMDPDWPHPDRAISRDNDRHRKFLTKYIESELADNDELRSALVPTYPPFGKRMLMDNGWYRALQRENASLVSEPVDRITGEGIVTTSGATYPVDMIVAATGFDVVRFLSTLEVTGLEGRTLREEWDEDNGAAYLGLAVPGFPNLFTLYGPNTQPGHGGSLIGTIEDQLDYVGDVLRQMFDAGVGSVEVRRAVYQAYVRRVDAAHDRMIWTHPGMETYYRNARGRVVVNSPFRNLEFWLMTRGEALEEVFECTPQRAESGIARTP